ncbi:pregnancy-specific glycoprotein 22-like [Pseudorasbora parva]|uniref:pregnancy-specific glycoprotein 22-like n=1 Tax=Pseudorasbora parva TaxID=51549 RepID=UPI00351EF8EF
MMTSTRTNLGDLHQLHSTSTQLYKNMQRMLLLSLFVLLLDGVSGEETDETLTVMEGDSVTLQTNLTEVLNDDTILWMFGPKDSVISQITRKRNLTSFFVTDNRNFIGKLQVDQKTGSLNIRKTRIRHSGQYKLRISRQKTTIKIFNVIVSGMVGETHGVKSVSVTEGESVTLQTDFFKVEGDDLIMWWFGDKGILLAKIDVETNETSLNDDDERFRDRLKLDQTGSLTIRNTKTEHSGLYEVQIRGSASSQRFLLSVTDMGLSRGIAAIIAVVALLLAVVVPCVVIYYRRKISELEEKAETPEEKVSATDGDSVTLKTNTKIEKDDTVKWWYHDTKHLIAEINRDGKRTYDGFDHRFTSKLELPDDDSEKNHQKGDLIIGNIMYTHSGLYILQISNKTRTINKIFILTVKMKERSVNEGDRVTLEIQTGPVIQPDDLILWTFGTENCLIVKADSRTTDFGERFRGRVELDKTTGSLTIRNITTKDNGHFKLQIINSKETTFKRYNVIVNGE